MQLIKPRGVALTSALNRFFVGSIPFNVSFAAIFFEGEVEHGIIKSLPRAGVQNYLLPKVPLIVIKKVFSRKFIMDP
jgi:hypothetical protein